MKNFQEILRCNNPKALEEYLNKKVNLKVQKRDIYDLIELYKNNKLNLFHYLSIMEKYPNENLRFINYKYKFENNDIGYIKAS